MLLLWRDYSSNSLTLNMFSGNWRINNNRKLALPSSILFLSSQPFKHSLVWLLRANVAKNQTFSKYCGNSSKINSAHILVLGRPQCETNHCIVSLAEYRFIFKKININGIRSKYRFWSSKFKANLEASHDKMKHSWAIKINQTCRMMFKYMSKTISAHLFTSSN